MVEVRFEWINGQLTPLKDGPVTDLETLTETKFSDKQAASVSRPVAPEGCKDIVAQGLTAANLARLGTDPDVEGGAAKKKISPLKKRVLQSAREVLHRESTGKSSDSPMSTKSTKTAKSDGSNKSTFSMKMIGNVVRAVKAFQRPLRKSGHHAHRGRYECQYCFEDLDASSCAVLLDKSGTRSCQHILHRDCCAALQDQAKKHGVACKPRCPSCSKAFASVVHLPNPVTQTDMWFEALDFRKCGKISKDDVMDHLMAVLPVKTDLRATLAPAPQKINLPSCKALIDRLKDKEQSKLTRRRPPPATPDIQKPSDWFNFWDIHEDGVLDRAGATRALVKTLKFDKLLLRAAIDEVWPEVVTRDGEDDVISLSKDEMFQPNTGLVDRTIRKAQAAQHWKLLRELNPM
jgi:hypothetical protein